MDWLVVLFTEHSIAHSVLIMSLVAATGLALGSIRVFGVSMGIAGVLFTGLIFGHFGYTIDHTVMEFAREFGLILFVYAIGLQVGPGFFGSLRRQGLPLNLLAAGIVISGMVIALGVSYLGNVEMPVAVGLFSGGTTNTPSLGAAQQALKEAKQVTDEVAKMPGLGYAIAYPFGVIGVILIMLAIKFLFKVNIEQENAHLLTQTDEAVPVTRVNLEVKNPNLDGVQLSDVPTLDESGVVISRVMHAGQPDVARPDTVLRAGDVLLAVGPETALRKLELIVGSKAEVDIRAVPGSVSSQRILVTKSKMLGKNVQELRLREKLGVNVTRITRAGVDLPPTRQTRLQFADALLVVGDSAGVERAAKEMGNSLKSINHPQVIPMFVGIALGIVLGSWPIFLPGMPAAVKLGLAGGPLVVAILLSRLGNIGPLVWYMPVSSNFILREVGIVLFLSCVGLKSGDRFIETLVAGDGMYWMVCGALVTAVPLIAAGLFGRMVMKLNYVTLCGVLAGSMTDPPALAFAQQSAGSEAPAVSYATVYPLTMLLRVLLAQVLVLMFM